MPALGFGHMGYTDGRGKGVPNSSSEYLEFAYLIVSLLVILNILTSILENECIELFFLLTVNAKQSKCLLKETGYVSHGLFLSRISTQL